MTTSKLKGLQVEDTRKAYRKVAADLLTYCLGITTGDIEESKTTFTPEMADAGRTLLTSLQTLSTRDQDDALQSFLFSLFSQK